jgi:hypothetical protein
MVYPRKCSARFCWPMALGWLILLGAGGCGSQNLFPVNGKVAHKDGTPVTAGMVIFEPVTQKVSARGEIKSDGTFQIGTYGNNDGAMEGEYKVVIAPPPLPEEGKRVRSPISPKYQSLESTPLKFTVTKESRKNKFDIQVD